jgi:hypothetical protein
MRRSSLGIREHEHVTVIHGAERRQFVVVEHAKDGRLVLEPAQTIDEMAASVGVRLGTEAEFDSFMHEFGGQMLPADDEG